MLKRQILAFIIIFTLLVPIAYGQTTINVIDTFPDDIIKRTKYTLTVPDNVYELTPKNMVEREVYYIQNQMPYLKNVAMNVYVVNQRISFEGIGYAAGLTTRKGDVYIFSFPKFWNNWEIYEVVGHEMGHWFMVNYISETELQEYVNSRKKENNYTNYYDSPMELFAEDFRWLFGSPLSKEAYGYLSNYNPPGEKEREWILSKIPKPAQKVKIKPGTITRIIKELQQKAVANHVYQGR